CLRVFSGKGDYEDEDIGKREARKPFELTRGNVLIDRQLHQIRLRQCRARKHRDGHERNEDQPPVRTQVLKQTPHQRGVVCLPEDFVVLMLHYEAANSSSRSCFLCSSAYKPLKRTSLSCVPCSTIR